MNNIIEYLQESREKLTLVGYFVAILILATPVSTMLATGWNRSGITRQVIRLRLLAGLDMQFVSISVFGLLVGLLILMLIDPKKRWQGFLLSIGVILGLVALGAQGKFLPNVDLIGRIHLVVGGIGLGLVVGGGSQLLNLANLRSQEFRRASKALYLIFVSFVVIELFDYHVSYPEFFTITADGLNLNSLESPSIELVTNNLLENVVVSGLFIVTLRQFVQYDAEKRFFILGPRASGKSLFLIGAYLEALERSDAAGGTPLKPSQDLMSMIEALDRQQSEWIVEATGRGELKHLSFQYVHGSVFPTNIQLSAMDYAGEYLARLPDAITGAIGEDEMDNTLRRLSEGVENASTLILCVDTERFVNNEPLDISEYFSILQATDNEGLLLVATKTDVLADEFEEQRGLEPHLYFDEFKEFVNNRLRQSENVDSLVTETAGAEIHPVYYQTKVNENGNRVPMRDDTGSVMTVGFDELLERIGRV